MKLDFVSIELLNFKSWRGSHAIEFGPAGLYFLRGDNEAQKRLGSNGAGKTSIFDALCWCLYGRTVDGLRGPDVRSWDSKKATVVNVTLKRDGKEHQIYRRVPNKLQLNADDVAQEQIETTIGMNVDTFTATVLLGQGQPLFFDMKPAQKMDLFVAALGLDRFDEYSKRAALKACEIKNKQDAIFRHSAALDTEHHATQEHLTSAQKLHDKWNTDRAEWLKTSASQLKALDKDLKIHQRKHDDANLAYDGAMTELKYSQEQAAKFMSAISQAQREFDRFQSERSALQKMSVSKTCPTCGGKVKTVDKKKEKSLDLDIATIEKRLTNARRQAADNQKHLDHFKQKADEALTTLDYVRPLLAETKAQHKVLTEHAATMESEINPHAQTLIKLKKKLKQLETDITAEDEKAEQAAIKYEQTSFWVKGFKDVRLYVLTEVLDELELATNAMLEDAGLVDWTVQYDIEKETKAGTITRGLTVRIKSPAHKEPVRWEAWSGGEAQRLRVVGALALSEVLLDHAGVTPSLEILDEPTQHLSQQGVNDLCDYLSDRAHGLGKTIYYVDHTSVESARFDGVLTVVKDAEGSFLENSTPPVR